jgi:Spy/CpxP family protein refolding chaperone
MKRSEWLGVVIPMAVWAAAVGCSDTPAQSPAGEAATATSAAIDDDQASVELKAHHRHHHGGYLGFVLAAVETVGVTPEQQAAIDKLKADLRAKVEPVRAANGAVINLLADGIAAGSIDSVKLDAAIATVGTAAQQIHAATAETMNQLHAILRPEQRTSLVDKIEAHWGIWKDANGGDQATDNAKADGHITHLAKELGLSPDQVAKTQAALAGLPAPARGPFDATAAEAHAKAFAAAFVADTFDAKTLVTADPANTKIASWGATRMARFYQALLPVLTADQRTQLANKLREHANES